MTNSTENAEKLLEQISTKIDSLRTDLREQINGLRTEFKEEITEVKISGARLEEKLIGIDKRLDDTNSRISSLEGKVNNLEGKLNIQGNWFLVIMSVLVGGLLTALTRVVFFPARF
jgi:septal ring factor EnvC (AmiA/AmiB activator)